MNRPFPRRVPARPVPLLVPACLAAALALALPVARAADAVAADASAAAAATSSPPAAARAGTPATAPVTLPGPAFPSWTRADQVDAACDAGLKGAEERVRRLERVAPGLPWLRAWDELNDWTEDESGPLLFLKQVHPDPAIRAASEACEQRWQRFQTTLGLDEAVYRGAARTRLRDPIDQQAVRWALEAFEDSGVTLPKARRQQAKALADRISLLGQDFERHIRDAHVRVAFTTEELQGVPERVWKDAPRDADGRVLLGVSYPEFFPVMQSATHASARERMWRAWTDQGGEDNLKVFAEITRLRRDYARLFGYASYDEFVLRRRMAGSVARATKFLDEVREAVRAGETRELDELRAAKAKAEGTPLAATTLQRWDVPYYTEIVKREKYAIDEETFRPYFPPLQSLQFVMRIAERLFGVRYVPVPGTYWHPDVQAYAVMDARSGKPLASLYVDLYPREGKYNHAAVWSLRNTSTAAGRTPTAALVVNFDRKGLTLSELETLLHEFGHSLHNNLSVTRWSSDGGTSVQRDFVEAPSQMLEDWVYDKRVLKLFQDVCPTCLPVPDELVDKARVARDYGKGVKYARQHLYASYDLAVHAADAPDPMATWRRMEGATPLGHVPGTIFPASFQHIASGGYAAGYYGYLWSLALAMDLRTAFAADKLDPAVGARYRDDVIGQGGQKPPARLVHDFLGRDFSTRPFFEYMKK